MYSISPTNIEGKGILKEKKTKLYLIRYQPHNDREIFSRSPIPPRGPHLSPPTPPTTSPSFSPPCNTAASSPCRRRRRCPDLRTHFATHPSPLYSVSLSSSMAVVLFFPNLAPARRPAGISPPLVRCGGRHGVTSLLREGAGGGGGVRVLGSAVTRQFSAPARSRSEGKKKGEYYVNTGHAIRTLREEMPAIFYKEPSFDIYRFEFCFSRVFFACHEFNFDKVSTLFMFRTGVLDAFVSKDCFLI